MKPRTKDLCIEESASVREAIASIDRNQNGIVLVVDGENRLVDTITDGDIRRAILAGTDLDTSVSCLMSRRADSPYLCEPITASEDTDADELRRMMEENVIRQIPLVNQSRQVVGLATWNDLQPSKVMHLQGVVMAGGFGTRLSPLTDSIPKPMLQIDGKPLLERIVNQLKHVGVGKVHIAVHYRSDVIEAYFRDGSEHGVEIEYVREDEPLGTGGALGLIEQPDVPTLVINGDIVTGVDFEAMFNFHRDHKAEMTVGVRKYDIQVPYAVVESDGVDVRRVEEKPTYEWFTNTGIYLIEPSAYQFIPAGERFDLPDLIQLLLDNQRRVISFPIIEYWLDIGQHDDYKKAQKDTQNGGRLA